MRLLNPNAFQHHVDFFNVMEPETIVHHVPNEAAWTWMKENIPLFECPDKAFEQIYYFRWWTFRKHLIKSPDGFVFSEFLAPAGHGGVGRHNTISCAAGHHIYEGTWLRNRQYVDEYARFWYIDHEGGLQPHFHFYSNWATWAIYRRYLVTGDKTLLLELLDAFVRDYQAWTRERGTSKGLFWSYDGEDGMEESISGGEHVRNLRPTLNSYLYGGATAIAKVAALAGREDLAREYAQKAARLKKLIHELLWDDEAKFFKVRRPDGVLADVREELGYIPWYFELPSATLQEKRVRIQESNVLIIPPRPDNEFALAQPMHEEAWLQFLDPKGFKAPWGVMTAERRHPTFRTRGVGTAEWDGAVWPYATSQTLVGLANALRHYPKLKQPIVLNVDYFNALMTYARCQQRGGKPHIGEYLDGDTGHWIRETRYYNHSTFCDLVISGLVGLVPREDDWVVVDPLVPARQNEEDWYWNRTMFTGAETLAPTNFWDWFCLDQVPYHGRSLTIVWDATGERYQQGPGLRVFADGTLIAQSDTLTRIVGRLP